MFRFKVSFLLIVICCFFSVYSPVLAATLELNSDGQLLGADDVMVNGSLYDVSFSSQDAESLFLGDNGYEFIFDTTDDAIDASVALYEQVFIDEYDAEPELTFGITNYFWGSILTPFDAHIDWYHDGDDMIHFSAAVNNRNFYDDTWYLSWNRSSRDVGMWSLYAVWSESDGSGSGTNTPIPEPGTFVLMGLGLLGLTRAARKR